MADLSTNGQAQALDRPGILFVGAPAVGKRTILHRIIASPRSDELDDDEDASSNLLLRGWTIENKYYKADVAVWSANLHKDTTFSLSTLPSSRSIAALVLIFDASEISSLAAIQEWVSATDTQKFDILLCVANKVDLLPTHPAHALYENQCSQNNLDESLSDPNGFHNSQTTSLLSGEQIEDVSLQIRTSCRNWCTDHNFEYIESCASNPEFDKYLSVDGDSQGVERIVGALSAHMWPGMTLKSGNMNPLRLVPVNGTLDSSEDESDYEFEYQVLSEGSAEPSDDTFGSWTSGDGNLATSHVEVPNLSKEIEDKNSEAFSGVESEGFVASTAEASGEETDTAIEENTGPINFDDVERLMSEIGNARTSLRLMPDTQRRETAANLAIKLASMFDVDSDDEIDSI